MGSYVAAKTPENLYALLWPESQDILLSDNDKGQKSVDVRCSLCEKREFKYTHVCITFSKGNVCQIDQAPGKMVVSRDGGDRLPLGLGLPCPWGPS